jgi:hypothetical protein
MEEATTIKRETEYKTGKSIKVICLWFIVLVIGLSAGQPNKKLFKFGPHEDLVFAGIKIDNWGGYTSVVIYTIISQICSSYVNSNLIPWSTNVIYDHKTKVIHMSYKHVMMTRFIHLLFEWLVAISDVLILFSLEIQFFFYLAICDIIVKMNRTNAFINGKCTIENNLSFIEPEPEPERNVEDKIDINGMTTLELNEYPIPSEKDLTDMRITHHID